MPQAAVLDIANWWKSNFPFLPPPFSLLTLNTVLTTAPFPKAYGVEFLPNVPYNPPHVESAPRAPEPYASNIFYYAQYDVMQRLSRSKPWTFCEIRPDAIIGFVPNNNAMNLAQGLGLFLAMYRDVEGEGAEVAYPGNEEGWRAMRTDTSQDILARFHVYASMHPEEVRERAFNVADGEAVSWAQVWPGICSYFGLEGVGPSSAGGKAAGVEWLKSRQPQWGEWVRKNGLKEGALEGTSWEFVSALTESATFDRQYDLSRIREVGFQEKVDTVMGYHLAFDRMRRAKIIP